MKGVTMNRGRHMAHIKVDVGRWRLVYLGRYATQEEAAAARAGAEKVRAALLRHSPQVAKVRKPHSNKKQNRTRPAKHKPYRMNDVATRSCADLGLC